MPLALFPSEQRRQQLLAAVISCAAGLNHFAEPQEQYLVSQYQRGRLTIDEVVYSLEARRNALGQPGARS